MNGQNCKSYQIAPLVPATAEREIEPAFQTAFPFTRKPRSKAPSLFSFGSAPAFGTLPAPSFNFGAPTAPSLPQVYSNKNEVSGISTISAPSFDSDDEENSNENSIEVRKNWNEAIPCMERDDAFKDCSFTFKDENIPPVKFHRVVLAALSKELSSLFTKNSDSNAIATSYSPAVINAVVKFCYTGRFVQSEDLDLFELITASKVYGLEELFVEVENLMLHDNKIFDIENVLSSFEKARELEASQILAKCSKIILQHHKEIRKNGKFESLSRDQILDVVEVALGFFEISN